MQAVFLMVLSTVLLTLSDATTKWLTQTYPVTQVWCLRTVFFVIEALRRGEASLVAPFKYTGLLRGLLFGYILWAQIPDLWTVAGAVLVVAGCVHIARVESAASTAMNRA